MAKTFLNADETFIVANNNSTIVGGNGSETIQINSGITGLELDGNTEKVELNSLAAADVELRVNNSNQLEFVNDNNVVATATAGLNSAVDVAFSDGNATLTQTGGASFSLADPDDDTDSVTVDANNSQNGNAVGLGDETSSGGGGGGGGGGTEASFTLTASANSVDEGGSVTYTVETDQDITADTTLQISLQGDDLNGNATAATLDDDVTVSQNNVTFAAGAAAGDTVQFTVDAKSDSTQESLEGFKVSLLDENFDAVASDTVGINDTTQPTGQNRSLTSGTDGFTGTSVDDTYNGTIQAAGADGTTIQPGDNIDGLAGTDELKISVAGELDGGNFTLSAVDTTSVEKVLLSNFDQGDNANNEVNIVDTALMSGLETVGLSSSSASGDTEFEGMNAIVGAEMSNGAADLTLTYNTAATSGASDVQTLAVSNLTGGTFTANGTETINVTTSLVDSEMAGIASDALETLSVSGDQDLTVTGTIEFAATDAGTDIDGTVDASSLTGALTITLDDGDGNGDSTVSVTGGSGADTVDMQEGLTENDVVDGGDGDDTMIMALDTGTDAFIAGQFGGVSNFETVTVGVHDVNDGQEYDLSELPSDVATFDLELNDLNNDGNDEQITNQTDQTIVLRNETGDDGAADTEVSVSNQTDTDDDTLDLRIVEAIADDDNDIETLSANNYETVNVESTETADAGDVTNRIDTLNASSATAINITGGTGLEIGGTTAGSLETLDASALTEGLTATLSDGDVAVTTGQADSTVNFGTSLDNSDSVTGGAGDDTVNATADGLTATTGALNTTNVETIELETANNASTIDATSITGAERIAVQGSQNVTVTNLAADVAMALGLPAGVDTTDDYTGTLDVSLADASGTDDSLTMELSERDGDASIDATLVAEDIETVVLDDLDTAASADADLDVSDLDATTIQATGGNTNTNLDLGTLSTSTSVVDAAGFAGSTVISADAANAPALTVTVNGSAADAHSITGSGEDDTISITGATIAAESVDGGAGTDSLTIDVADEGGGNAFSDTSNISNVEDITFTVRAGDSIEIADDDGLNDAAVNNITIDGGNSLSEFSLAAAELLDQAGLETVDASGFGGNIDLELADTAFTGGAAVSVTGTGASDDSLTVDNGGNTDGDLTMSAVESLNIVEEGGAAELDTSNLTGVETIALRTDQELTLSSFAAGVAVQAGLTAAGATQGGAGNGVDTGTIVIGRDSVSGDSDSQTVRLADTNGTTTATFDIDDVETLDFAHVPEQGGTAETVQFSLNGTTNDNDITLNLTDGADGVDVNVADGGLVSDVVTVNASTLASNLDVGDDARANTDAMTITGGDGDDTVGMENEADVLTGGDGTDTLEIDQNGVLGGFKVDLSASGDQVTTYNGAANAAVQSGFENVDLSNVTGSNGADITANADGSTITGTANADQITGGDGNDTVSYDGSDAVTVDLSDNTNNDGGDADGDVLSNIENLIGSANGDTLTGDDGDNTITGGAGADTITGGAGADNLTGGGGDDTFVYAGDGTDGGDTINNFTQADDDIDFDNSSVAGADGTATDLQTADLSGGGDVATSDGLIVVDSGIVPADNVTLDEAGIADAIDGTSSTDALTLNDGDEAFYVAVDNGVDTAIALVDDANGDGDDAIDDGEISIIGTLDGVADASQLDATNFADFT